jgi:porin
MKIDLTLFLFPVFVFMSLVSNGQDSTESKISIIEPTLGYTCDIARNFSGGIKTGNAYMGLVDAGVLIHTDKLWKGGAFSFEIMNTHGYNLSGNCVGDLQVISNIENGDYTFLENVMYRQDFSKLSLLVGLQDLNAEFCVSEYGGALTNSSFGIQSTFPLNFGVPLYPKTALALAGLFSLNDNITIRASLWDADAGSLEDDPHNFDWSISTEEGLLTVEEIEFKSSSEKLTDVKVGGFYHSGEFTNTDDDTSAIKGNMGFYAICDKQIYSNGTRMLGVFGQLAIFPSKANFNTAYIGAGMDFAGILEKRPDDCLAAGFAYSRLFDKTYECDIEFNYSIALIQHLSLQPAFHYIIHPGANQGLDNAIAAFLRISLSL